MSVVRGVTVLMRSTADVESAHRFLTGALHLPSRWAATTDPTPIASSTRGCDASASWLVSGAAAGGALADAPCQDAVSAAVAVSPSCVLELVHLPRLSRYRLRESVHRAADVVAVTMQPSTGSSSASPHASGHQPSSAGRPSAWTRWLSVVSLATGVSMHPQVLPCSCPSPTAAPPAGMALKEVVLGHPSVAAIAATNSQMLALGAARHKALPHMWTAGGAVVRLVPSPRSAVVMHVPPAALADVVRNVGQEFTEPMGFRAGCDVMAELGLKHPALAGLDLRLVDSDVVRPYFVEARRVMEAETHPGAQPPANSASVSCKAASLSDVTSWMKTSLAFVTSL